MGIVQGAPLASCPLLVPQFEPLMTLSGLS
jgi:hypothetical protein